MVSSGDGLCRRSVCLLSCPLQQPGAQSVPSLGWARVRPTGQQKDQKDLPRRVYTLVWEQRDRGWMGGLLPRTSWALGATEGHGLNTESV